MNINYYTNKKHNNLSNIIYNKESNKLDYIKKNQFNKDKHIEDYLKHEIISSLKKPLLETNFKSNIDNKDSDIDYFKEELNSKFIDNLFSKSKCKNVSNKRINLNKKSIEKNADILNKMQQEDINKLFSNSKSLNSFKSKHNEIEKISTNDFNNVYISNYSFKNNIIDSYFTNLIKEVTSIFNYNNYDFPINKIIPHNKLNQIQQELLPDLLVSKITINENSIMFKNDCKAKNMIISSPTGSGKTTLFEIAICNVFNSILFKINVINNEISIDNAYKEELIKNMLMFKVVYIAPIKSLCQEKLNNWKKRFSILNLKIVEVTGDNTFIDYNSLLESNIILSTPERWESITRNWKTYPILISNLSLFMIDEIHMLDDDERGSTLETIITRIKLFSKFSEFKNSLISNIRIIAVSASFPNINDLGLWLKNEYNCVVKVYNEEYRPIQIQKHVLGYNNFKKIFLFENYLKYKLANIINQYSDRKPTLVFCQTQKGTVEAAKQLAIDCIYDDNDRIINGKKLSDTVDNKVLGNLLDKGIGFHNSSLNLQDRQKVEEYFKSNLIKVICTTSTLAQGVNLPARLVIIKSTYCYRGQNTGFTEYSNIEIDQMIGRAGRPQYDNKGVAVIMTEMQNLSKYLDLINKRSNNRYNNIESKLKKKLIEFINSEIVMETLNCLEKGMQWLKSTFWYIKNKKYIDNIKADMYNMDYSFLIRLLFTDILINKFKIIDLDNINKEHNYHMNMFTDYITKSENYSYNNLVIKLNLYIKQQISIYIKKCNNDSDKVLELYSRLVFIRVFFQLEQVHVCNINIIYKNNYSGLLSESKFLNDNKQINLYQLDDNNIFNIVSEINELIFDDKIEVFVYSTNLGKKMNKNFIYFSTVKEIYNDLKLYVKDKNLDIKCNNVNSKNETNNNLTKNKFKTALNSNFEEFILNVISKSKELEDFKSKMEDRKFLNKANKEIKYKLKSAIDSYSKKSYVLIQCTLGGINIDSWELKREQSLIISLYSRALEIIKEVLLNLKQGKFLIYCIILSKSISQQMWSDSVFVLKQLPKIGDKICKNLSKNSINHFNDILQTNARKIEAISGKNSPFGNTIINYVKSINKINSIELKKEKQYNYKTSSSYTINLNISVSISSSISISNLYKDDFNGYNNYSLIIVNSKFRIMYNANIKPKICKKTYFKDALEEVNNLVPFEIYNHKVYNIEISDYPIIIYCISNKFIGLDYYVKLTNEDDNNNCLIQIKTNKSIIEYFDFDNDNFLFDNENTNEIESSREFKSVTKDNNEYAMKSSINNHNLKKKKIKKNSFSKLKDITNKRNNKSKTYIDKNYFNQQNSTQNNNLTDEKNINNVINKSYFENKTKIDFDSFLFNNKKSKEEIIESNCLNTNNNIINKNSSIKNINSYNSINILKSFNNIHNI